MCFSCTEPVFNKDQPLLTHINSTHAGLNLQGWTSGGCPITDLMLDFRPKGTWAWQSLKANSTTQLFLSELREATWYELKMKACNSAGCGNQSSQFATTDYDGSKCVCGISFQFSIFLHRLPFLCRYNTSHQVSSRRRRRREKAVFHRLSRHPGDSRRRVAVYHPQEA